MAIGRWSEKQDFVILVLDNLLKRITDMSVLAVPTDTGFREATEKLVPSVPLLISGMMKPEPQSQPALSVFGTRSAWASRVAGTLKARSTYVREISRPAYLADTVSKPEVVIAVLRVFRLDAIADRLDYLQRLVEGDPDEPSMVPESLRALVHFLIDEQQLPAPQISVSPDGLAQIEWRIPTNGILAMEFLPSGLIRFAAISAPARSGVERENVNGTLSKDATLDAIRPFTARL